MELETQPRLTNSDLLADTRKESAIQEFARSIAYSGLQNPLTAIAQPLGLEKSAQIIAAPEEAEFASGRYWLQQTGSAVGMIGSFALAGLAVRKFTRLGLNEAQLLEKMGEKNFLGLSMKEAAMTGFVHDSLLRPTDAKDTRGLLLSRLGNGTSGALTMATLAWSGMKLKGLGMQNEAAIGVVSGLPAGLLGSQSDHVLRTGSPASLEESVKAMYTMSVMGGTFGLAREVWGQRNKPQEKQVEQAPEKTLVEKAAEKTGGEKTSTEPASLQPARKSAYVSDTVDVNGTRTIVKDDGTRVVIPATGKARVELSADKLAAKSKTAVPAEKVQTPGDRVRHTPPDFSHLPAAERPLNVGAGNAELIAREMSNFERSPFQIDGRTFASVEAFYVWLKWSGDVAKQAIAQDLHGAEAKKFGKASTNTTAMYDGVEIKLGSPEHHALIKRAIQAKLEQHPDLARRFAETYPRAIIHDLGYPENPGTRLPAKDFACILSDLRQDLVDGKIVTREGPVSKLSEAARLREASMQANSSTVSEILRAVDPKTEPWVANHPVQRYAAAFEGLNERVTRLMNGGADSLVFETVDGNVLKVTGRSLTDRMGTRSFDLPIIDRGTVESGSGGQFYWFKQPRAQTPVTYQQFRDFKATIAKDNWYMQDAGENQLGVYNGSVRLIDPFAVQKLD